MECNAEEWNGMESLWVILVILRTFGGNFGHVGHLGSFVGHFCATSKKKTPIGEALPTSFFVVFLFYVFTFFFCPASF